MALSRILPGITLSIFIFPGAAQQRDSRAEFEAATIRPVQLESRTFAPTALRRDPVRISYSYVDLRQLVMMAYDLPDYRVEWPERLVETSHALYSVAATFPKGTTDTELQDMLQRLLEERLALRTRWIKKTLPSYELEIASGGPKLSRARLDPAESRTDPYDEVRNHYSIFQGVNGQWRGTGVISMAQLTRLLRLELGKPLIDRTGMPGYYDIDFSWNRPNTGPPSPAGQLSAPGEASLPAGDKAATLLPALEKQLGLKAEPLKLVTDVLTIDSVERTPKDN